MERLRTLLYFVFFEGCEIQIAVASPYHIKTPKIYNGLLKSSSSHQPILFVSLVVVFTVMYLRLVVVSMVLLKLHV